MFMRAGRVAELPEQKMKRLAEGFADERSGHKAPFVTKQKRRNNSAASRFDSRR
jgi:hypothetical protein